MPTLKEIVDKHGLPVKVMTPFRLVPITIEFLSSNGKYLGVCCSNFSHLFTSEQAALDGFSLYTEPKKKKVLYKWLMEGYTSSKKHYYEASLYHETSEQVELYEMKKPIKRLDYTMVEVEE